jgi:hypothetical protein
MPQSKILTGMLMSVMSCAIASVYADAPADSPETLAKAKSVGLRPETTSGVTLYCRRDSDTNSRLPTKKCYAASQLDQLIHDQAVTRHEIQGDQNHNGAGSH